MDGAQEGQGNAVRSAHEPQTRTAGGSPFSAGVATLVPQVLTAGYGRAKSAITAMTNNRRAAIYMRHSTRTAQALSASVRAG